MEQDIPSGSFHLSSLQILSLRKGGILSDIFHQSSLVSLSSRKRNLVGVGIPHDIWNLSSLISLSLSYCNLMEGEILNHICHLSSLKELSLVGSHFSSLPAGISQLSNLIALNLSHCKNLRQIPELPSSLRFLDAHSSDGISSSPSFLPIHSLINFSKSKLIQDCRISVGGSFFQGKGISIVIPRSSGILEWIRCQSMGSDEVTIELPPKWYEDNDLLGFALCCVYVASAHKSQNESAHTSENEPDNRCVLEFSCALFIKGNKQSAITGVFSLCFYCVNDGVSDMEWVIYYPKVAARESFHSNLWTHFEAQFRGSLRVKECGIRLIYTEDCEQKHPTMAQGSTSHGNFGVHGSATEDICSKAHNKGIP